MFQSCYILIHFFSDAILSNAKRNKIMIVTNWKSIELLMNKLDSVNLGWLKCFKIKIYSTDLIVLLSNFCKLNVDCYWNWISMMSFPWRLIFFFCWVTCFGITSSNARYLKLPALCVVVSSSAKRAEMLLAFKMD